MNKMFSRLGLALIVLASSLSAAVAETKTITGTVSYLERIALPPGAVMDVQLLDVSRQDVAATTIAAQRFAMNGVPQSFSLSYDPAVIDPALTYTIRAQIWLDDRVLYRTTQAFPVLTGNGSDDIAVFVTSATAELLVVDLVGTSWVVQELGGRMLTADQLPTISFPQAGRVAVFAGCNRFSGAATPDNGKLVFPEALAGTMMACPPAQTQLENEMVDALEQVRGYVARAVAG